MKTLSILTFGILLSLAIAPQLGAAPQFGQGRQGRDRVCVYQDANYQGWEQCYMPGDEVSSLHNRNSQASSIRFYGRVRVTVYDETSFNGRTAEFYSDIPDLKLRSASGGHTWNDRIQSLRVTSDYDRGYPGSNSNRYPEREPDRYPSQYPNQSVNDGICVYDQPNFQGRSDCWSGGENLSDLARVGSNWNDKIASIRVFGGTTAVLYRDIHFAGDSIMIRQDVPDLRQIPGRGFRNWDHQISSIQIEPRRGDFGSRPPRERRWQ